MEFQLPFWDRLFQFLTPAEQVNLMTCCSRVSKVGHTRFNVFRRVAQVRRNYRERSLSNQTAERCLEFVKNDGYHLRLIHPENRTLEVLKAAIQENGNVIQDIPFFRQTLELCFLAVSSRGNAHALAYIDPKYMTREVCLAAVAQEAFSLKLILPEKQTEDICMAAVRKHGESLQHVIMKHRTPDVCLAAVTDFVGAFKFVPENLQTLEMCLLAVQNSGSILQYVTLELRTPEVCLAAVRNNGIALVYVPDKHRSREICFAAVQESAYAFRHVPLEHQTAELSLRGFKRLLTSSPVAIPLMTEATNGMVEI